MTSPQVSIVIPALNEERNLPHVFDRIPEDIHEVILVDGQSVDNTVKVARKIRPDVCVVPQTRRGKGNALACGFEAATGDVIAMIDADGSADPGEIPRFVSALVEGADFAKGTRFSAGGGSSDITHLRKMGNSLLTRFFNACYHRNYSDLCYGYNVFWRKYVPILGLDCSAPSQENGIALWGDGFEIETLIHVRVARAGLRVTEVPSYEHSRIHGASNLNATRDGIRVVRTILAERTAAAPPILPPLEAQSVLPLEHKVILPNSRFSHDGGRSFESGNLPCRRVTDIRNYGGVADNDQCLPSVEAELAPTSNGARYRLASTWGSTQ